MKRKFILSNTKMKRKRLAAGSNRGPKALAGSISSFCRVLAVSAITALGIGEAKAVTLFWDPGLSSGASLGGSGNWTLADTNWWNGAGPDGLWNNIGSTDAVFGNFGGTVSVDDALNVGSLRFTTGGYTLNGFGSINFGSVNRTILVENHALLGIDSVTISTFLKGTGGFTKAGAGQLVLNSDNTAAGGITGGVVMAGGTLILNYTSTSPGIILNQSNTLTFTNTSEFQYQADSLATASAASMTLSALTFSGGEGKVNSAPQQAVDPALLTFTSLGARAAGATGNFVQKSVPKVASALAGSGSTITLSIADANAVNSFYLGESVTGTNIPAGRTVTSVDTGTGVVTLSGPTTAVAGQGITFGLQNRRIVLGGQAAGFINQGTFFNGSSYAWYDTADFARVRGISYGVDAATGTSSTSTTGIPGIAAKTGNTTAGSNSVTLANATGITIGMTVYGNGLPAGETVTGIAGNVITITTGTGVTTVANSSLTFAGHMQVTGDVTGQGSATIKTLNLSGTSFTRGVLQNPGTILTLTNGGILKSGDSVVTISGGTIATVGATEFVFRADKSNDRLTINSVLAGTGGVTKSGDGSLLLNAQTAGALSLSGATTTNLSTTLQLPSAAPQGLVDYVNFLSANGLPAMAVNGPGIPANTTISSISGSTVTLSQAANANAPLLLSYATALAAGSTITLSPAQAATLTVGQTVTGTSILPNTTISSINTATGDVALVNTSGTPIVSTVPLQTVSFGGSTVAFGNTQNFNLTAGPQNGDHIVTNINSATVTLQAGIASLVPGMSVTSAVAGIISSGTTIVSVSGNSVTLSQVVTASSASTFGNVNTFVAQVGTSVGGGSRTTTNLPPGSGSTLVPGSLITGVNIPASTKVGSVAGDTVTFSSPIPAAQTFTPAAAAPASSTTLAFTTGQASNLYVNESISGAGIASGSTITAINTATGTVTLSAPTTATVGTGTNLTFGVIGNQNLTFGGATLAFGSGTITLSPAQITPAQAASLVVGATVSGTNIAPNTTITGIQDFGTYKIVTLSKDTTGAASPQFLSFGGASIVGINSAYGGGTQVNSGVFSVSSAGLPAVGAVNVSGSAEFAAFNSIIPNAITLSGPGARLSGTVGNNGGFSGPIAAGTNDFQLVARDFRDGTAANVLISGNITGTGGLTIPAISTGIVTLTGNNTAFTGPVTIDGGKLSVARLNSLFGNAVTLKGGTLLLSLDGDGGAAYAGGNGTGTPQTLLLNNTIDVDGSGTLQPDRDGTAYGGYFTSASNKTIQLNQLTIGVETLTVQNNRGSGVQFIGNVTMNGPSTFDVINATASNAVPGLSITGKLTGGGNAFGNAAFGKSSAGTLVLANITNDFGGNGSFIDISGGVLSVATDAALGDPSNSVQLNSATLAALRATGTFTTSRQIILAQATGNTIEVTAGNTLTLNSQLILPSSQETNLLIKGDNGILILAVNNSVTTAGGATTFGTDPWKGLLTINAGAVRISNGNVLGTTDAGVTVARTGAALQLNGATGAAAVADRLTLTGSGLASAGALQSFGGINTFNGQIILSGGATIGADTGTTLTLTGGITGTAGVTLTLNASGTINITTNALDPAYVVTGSTGTSTIITGVPDTSNLILGQNIRGTDIQAGTTITGKTPGPNGTITISKAATGANPGTFIAQSNLNVIKFGTGTAALQVDSPAFGGTITVNQGTFSIGGSGVTIGPATASNTLTIQGPSGVLTVSDSTGGAVPRIAVIGSFSATFNSGSGTINLTPAQAAQLTVGQTVTGVGIAPNTTVSAVRTSGGAITGVVDLSVATTTAGPQNLIFAARNLVLAGGTFTYTGNSTGSVQNLGWLTALRGATNVITSNQTSGGAVSLNFGGLAATTAANAATTIGGGASINFQGANLGINGTNTITLAAAPSLTSGILQRATIQGTEFVTYNAIGGLTLTTTNASAVIPVTNTSFLTTGQAVTGTGIPAGSTISSIIPNTSITLNNPATASASNFLTFSNANGIQAFTTFNSTNNVDTALGTDTLNFTANPASAFTAPHTINAFKISGNITVADNGGRGNNLSLSSGAILSPSGTNIVDFKTLAFGTTEAFLAVNAGSSLTVSSLFTGSGGLVKGLAGSLQLSPPNNSAGYANLSAQTLTGNFAVNGGTVQLKAGQNNTLTPNQFLIVAPGASIDLNGTSQFAQGTRGDGAALQGNAGTFTNTSASPAALIFGPDTGATSFGGVITQAGGSGSMSFFKGGSGAYGFLNANPYTGPTIFAGGTNTLLDGGTLPATTSIGVNFARLAMDDNQTFALANRVNAAATITLRGGSLAYTGRSQTASAQTVGPVVLGEGMNLIQATNGGTGVNSATLTLASLTRPGGSTATLRFPDNGTLGILGNSANIVITAAPTLSQNIIGPWAVVDREYASYISVLGVGALNATGFAGYSANFLNRQPLTSDNIRATVSVPGLAVDTTVNTLAVNSNLAAINSVPVPTTIDLGGKKLTLLGGGLLLALGGDNQNITVQNGTITSGAVNVGGDLYLQALNYGGSNRTFTVSAGIVNNGTGAVRLIKSSGAGDTAPGVTTADFLMLSGVNTYTGGTVINGGNLVVGAGGNIPAGGLTISGGEVSGVGNVFQDPGGVIASTNTVTVNGLGALTLAGTNTLAGLVFNNAGGGTTAPTVTTFRSLSPLGSGTLTLGGGGITSTPVNPSAVATVAGRLDFGVAASTVLVNGYNFSTFTDFAPTTAGLVLQGVIGSGGGINKTGAGVLQLNAQEIFTGPLNVQAGTVQLGVGNAGSRFSQLNLSTATSRLNLNGQNTVLGSLAGNGIVTNTNTTVSPIPTLSVGFDNTSSTFSGQISRFNDAAPAALTLVKIGTGTLTMTSAQNDSLSSTPGSNGGVTVNGGGLTYSGAGAGFPSTVLTAVTYTVNTGGTLTLDNVGTNKANRLGVNVSPGTLNLSGGTLVMLANSVGSTESINILGFGNGASTIQLTRTSATDGATVISVATLGNQGGQDSGLITGTGLGGSGAGSVNIVVSPGYAVPGTQGGGGAGSETIPIRPDLLGDATGGSGTGFILRDTGNILRPLNQTTELSVDMIAAGVAGATSNTGLTSAANATTNRIIASQTINSLTLLGVGTPTLTSGLGAPAGVYAASGLPLTLTAGSGGILALTNATISIGAITTGGVTGDYHVVGANTTLTLNGSIISSTNGIVKADAGTLILNARQYYTGGSGTTVNGGTLRLGGGDNTIVVQPTGSVPTALSLFMNGGTLDLNGTSQIVERISNNNPNAGIGGIIVNSLAGAVTLTSASGTNGTTFSGSIGTGLLSSPTGNAINFTKSGNSTLVLTNVNTYTGATVIRGGGLTLQDSGTLAQTSSITVNFGTLLLNEAGLNPLNVNPVRTPVAAAITLNGALFQQNSGGSLDAIGNLNTVILGSGASNIVQSVVQGAGSSAIFNIGSLVQQNNAGTGPATVNFASANGTLGGGGLNNNEFQIATITPSGSAAAAPASLLVNGMLPAWITVSGSDFASYLTVPVAGSVGIGAIGSTNYPAYAAPLIPFSTTAMPAAQIPANANSANNLSVAATVLPIAARTVNSLAGRNPAAGVDAVIPINLPTDTLTIASGGLLLNSSNGGASITVQGGRISGGNVANTAGALYVTATGGNPLVINSQIVDNGNQVFGANYEGVHTDGTPQSSVITVGSTSGLVVGQVVSGAGITGGSTITAITSPTTFTISNPTTAASFLISDASLRKTNSALTNGSGAVNVANTGNLAVGMYVTGPGIPAGTTVTALGTTAAPTTITLSNNATATLTQQNYFLSGVGAGQQTFTVSAGQAATLKPGMTVTGSGIPGNTTVASVGSNSVTLSNPTTGTTATQLIGFGVTLNFARLGINVAMPSGTNNPPPASTLAVVNVNNLTGLVAGMQVNGPGIPAGTVILGFGTLTNTVPNNSTVFIQAPTGQNFDAMTSNNGINLVFGTGISVGNGTPGAESLVKTGTGTLTLTPQLVMNGSLRGSNQIPNNVITVPTAADLVAGMTVSGSGIPAGSTILAVTGTNTFQLSNNVTVNLGTQLSFGPGTSGISLPTSAFSNNYTGGTFVNQGTLALGGFAGAIVIPGDLTINNAGVANVITAISGDTVTSSNSITLANVNGLSLGMGVFGAGIPTGEFITGISGNTITISTGTGVVGADGTALTFANRQQIAATANVTLNGGGALALIGTNTLGSVTFKSGGSSTTPAIVIGSGENLTLTNGITVTNDSLSLTPVIFGAAGATLTLANSTITTSGASPNSLLITAPLIPTGALVKNGTGSLILGPTVSLQQTSSTTLNSTTITVANGSGLAVGMAVSGTGIAGGSTIRTITGNSVTLSQGASTSATNILTFAQTSPALSTFAGGVNLNAGSIIFALNSTQLSSGAATSSGSTTVAVASTAGLAIGMGVSGTGLPAGEYITAIGSGNITITTATGVTTQPATTLSFTGANTVLAGPVGTGPVNMADGSAILSDGTLRLIGNAVNIALNATFGPLTGSGTALAGNGVTLTGPVTLTGGGAHTITVPDLQNVTTIAGTLSGGSNLNLTKAGTGTLVLSNASAGAPNTYTGTTAMNVVGGVLKLGAGAPAAVPAGMSLSVSQGAVYDINGNANQVLSAVSGGGLVTNSGGATTLFVGGTTTADNSTNVSALFDGMFTAATLANLSLTKVGIGTLTLNGSSNYTGATTVNSGKLIVNGALGATTVTVNTGATIGGTGRVGVNTFTPGGIFPTAGGSVVLAGGIFDLRNTSIGTFTVNSSGTATALTVNAGSSFNFDFSTNSVDKIDLGNNTLQSNGTAIPVNFTALGGTLANGIYNLITFGTAVGTGNYALGTGAPAGSVLALTGSALELNVGNVPLQFFWKGNLSAFWNAGGSSNWVRDIAAGAAANTIPNTTSIVNFNATTPANFNTSLGANFTIDQLLFNTNSASTLTIGGGFTLTLNNNLNMATGTAAVNITTNGLALGSPQTWTNSSTSSLTVTAPVTGSFPLTIASTSTGRVILSGSNSGFTGGITVNGNGTNTAVQLGSGTALGLTVAGLNNNPLVVNNGAVDMNGQNATISSLSSTANTGIIRNDLTGTSSILSVIQGGTTTYSGVFKDAAVGTGKLALIVDGGGTLQLTTPVGTNLSNYSGGTTIGIVAGLGATVKMGNSGSEIVTSLGTGPVTINSGGTLSFSPGSVTTVFNIANSFILAGGQIQSSGGNQHLLANSAVGAANINVTAASSITPSTASAQDLFIDGVLTGSAALTVGGSGSGKVILTNNGNTYNGTLTSSSAGNLQIAGTLANSTALASADVILNSGANGLSFASPVTSATFGSLQGSGNFALQNNATTPLAVTLTVGGKNNASPLTYGGVMSNSAAGINGSLVKIGTGTLILSGLNTYRGATTVNVGALLVNNNSLTGSVTGLGSVSVTGTATLGGNGVIQGGNNLAAGSVSLAANTFLDPGLTAGGFGTLRFGVQSGAAFDTTLTLASTSTYKFDVGAGPGSQDRVLVVGPATITGAKLAITAGTGANTPDQGNYTILSTTAGITDGGTPFSGGVTGTPSFYSVVRNPNTIDLQHFSTIGTISTTAGLQVIKGATVAFPVTVANSAPSGSADLTFSASSGSFTTGSVSALVVSAGSTNTGAGLSFDSAPAGVLIGTGQIGNFTVTAVNSGTNTQAGTSQPGTVTVDVFDHAAFTGFTGGTLSFQPVRVGYVGPVTSTNSLSVTNTAGHRVNLKGSTAAPIGNISLNSISGIVQGGAPGLITASLLSGQPAGSYSQVFSYSLGDDSTLNGSNNGALGSVNITVNGDVYTGQGVWGASANGSWGTFTRWAAPGGFPGLDGAASVNDTATFGSTLTGSATLDGVSPAVTKITFNATNGTIAQGTAGSVTLQNDGSQTPVAPSIVVTGGTVGTPAKPIISAPMVFANTPNLAPATVNDQLTISGPISGPGGLTKVGAGTVILSGTNGYLGKTSVTAGTLSVTNETNLGAPVSGVPVPDQISLDTGGKLAFTGDANISVTQGITVGSSNGTLDVAANKTVVVNSVITGTLTGGSTTGTLTKTGPGTLNLRNNIQPSDISLPAPAFILSAGTFSLAAGAYGAQATAALNTGAVTFSGGTLAINIQGTDLPGTLNGTDYLTANNSPGTGPSFKITATTNLSINFGTFTPSVGNSFTFLTDATRTTEAYSSFFFVLGQDAGVAGPYNSSSNHVGKLFYIGANAFHIDYAGGSGGDVVLLSAVPEPGTAALLLGAVGVLGGVVRRRRARNVPFGN